jgi:hypothetical protein
MTGMATETWDYITGSFGMVGVVLTLAAVLVALFGPAWRAKKRRPKLSLSATDVVHEAWNADMVDDLTEGFLLLEAAKGKDTAEDVEVHVSVAKPLFKGSLPMRVRQSRRVCFDSFTESEDGEPRSNVPSGFVRRIPWAAVGHYRTLWALVPKGELPPGAPDAAEYYEDNTALLNLHPRNKRTVAALDTLFGGTYYVHVTVTGSNFDALNYSGVVDVEKGSEPMSPEHPESPHSDYWRLKWTHVLRPTTEVPPWVRP